jgi:hypothetical protein
MLRMCLMLETNVMELIPRPRGYMEDELGFVLSGACELDFGFEILYLVPNRGAKRSRVQNAVFCCEGDETFDGVRDVQCLFRA